MALRILFAVSSAHETDKRRRRVWEQKTHETKKRTSRVTASTALTGFAPACAWTMCVHSALCICITYYYCSKFEQKFCGYRRCCCGGCLKLRKFARSDANNSTMSFISIQVRWYLGKWCVTDVNHSLIRVLLVGDVRIARDCQLDYFRWISLFLSWACLSHSAGGQWKWLQRIQYGCREKRKCALRPIWEMTAKTGANRAKWWVQPFHKTMRTPCTTAACCLHTFFNFFSASSSSLF